MLARVGFLWCQITKVTQQSLSERFLVFPSELFECVFKDLLPQLQRNWQQRLQRPLPDSVKVAWLNISENQSPGWIYKKNSAILESE